MDPELQSESLSVGKRCKYFWSFHWRGVFMVSMLLIFSPLLFVEPVRAMRACYMLCVMAVFWITEVIPLGVTSMIPIVALPIMNILDSRDVCLAYCQDALILFVGSLIVALAIEASNLHKRVALNIILLVGCTPRRLHFSLMMLTMFISMWITNSAATAMMCPVIKAVLQEMESQGMLDMIDKTKEDQDPPYPSRPAIAFYMGVAYAASIGGLGTLIGTGTNIAYKGLYDGRFPGAGDMEFLPFSCYTIPSMLCMTLMSFVALNWQYLGLFRPNSAAGKQSKISKEGIESAKLVIMEKRRELGGFSCRELQVAVLFLFMVALFITRKPGFFTGYADIFDERKIGSSFPLMVLTVAFFALPIDFIFLKYCCCRKPAMEGAREPLLNWPLLNKRHPWNLFFLLGGGFAMSDALRKSGFAELAGNGLAVLENLPHWTIQLICIIVAIIGTAFTSNIAACNVLVTILLELAVAVKMHPGYITLPVCLALSTAFHLPVSTPPNAIVSGFAGVRTKDMAAAGVGPSLIAVVNIFFWSQTWGRVVFPTFSTFPSWAKE